MSERPDGLLEGPEGLPEGPEGLLGGSQGPSEGLVVGGIDGQMDRQNFFPFYRTFSPATEQK